MDKIIKLAKKLNALAERGVDGEKVNAQKMLEDLLSKYGISLDDIEDSKVGHYVFTYKNIYRRIMSQCIIMIMGKGVEIWGHKNKKAAFIVQCTSSQFIEINAAYDFFSRAYQKELDLFTSAFIYKNNLLPFDAERGNDEVDSSELAKILSMMRAIDKNEIRKQLN